MAPAANRGQRVVPEVRLHADRQREDHRPDEVQQGQRAGARVAGAVADHQRDEAREQQQDRVRVAEARPAQQERRPEAQPGRRPARRRSGTRRGRASRSSRRAGERLRARRRSRTTHPERPDELEAVAPLAPLVEQHQREQERQERGQAREQRGHRLRPPASRPAQATGGGTARAWRPRRHRPGARPVLGGRDLVGGHLVGGHERQQQPVEQAGRGVVDVADPGRVHAPPAGHDAQLGEERAAGGRRTSTRRPRAAPRGSRAARPGARRGPPRRAPPGRGRGRSRRGGGPARPPGCARSRGTTRAPTPGTVARGSGASAVVLAVPAAVRRAQAVLARAEAREPAGGSGAPGRDEALQGAALEPAVAARGRERRHPALVRPAAERVGIDAQEAARLAERRGGRAGAGRRDDRWSDTGSPLVGSGRRDAEICAKLGRSAWPGGRECRAGRGRSVNRGVRRASGGASRVDQAGTNSWSSRWMPSQRPQRRRLRGQRDRAHDLAHLAPAAEQVAVLPHPAADARGVRVELVGARVHGRGLRPADGDLGGHDVEQVHPPGRPGMTSRQPSQRIATLSLTMVRIVTPMISIAPEDSRGRGCVGQGERSLRAPCRGPAGGSARWRPGSRGGPRSGRPRRSRTRGPRPTARSRPSGPVHGRGEQVRADVEAAELGPRERARDARGARRRARSSPRPSRTVRSAGTPPGAPSRSATKVAMAAILEPAAVDLQRRLRPAARRNTGDASRWRRSARIQVQQRRRVGGASARRIVTPSGSGPGLDGAQVRHEVHDVVPEAQAARRRRARRRRRRGR